MGSGEMGPGFNFVLYWRGLDCCKQVADNGFPLEF